MFARSRAVEKRSIRLPNWWLTWGGWGWGRERMEGEKQS